MRRIMGRIVNRRWSTAALLLTGALAAADLYLSAKQKIDSIEAGHLRPGTRVTFTYPELEAWVAHEMPDGVRNPRIRVTAPEIATGTALIDFGKVQRARGEKPGW